MDLIELQELEEENQVEFMDMWGPMDEFCDDETILTHYDFEDDEEEKQIAFVEDEEDDDDDDYEEVESDYDEGPADFDVSHVDPDDEATFVQPELESRSEEEGFFSRAAFRAGSMWIYGHLIGIFPALMSARGIHKHRPMKFKVHSFMRIWKLHNAFWPSRLAVFGLIYSYFASKIHSKRLQWAKARFARTIYDEPFDSDLRFCAAMTLSSMIWTKIYAYNRHYWIYSGLWTAGLMTAWFLGRNYKIVYEILDHSDRMEQLNRMRAITMSLVYKQHDPYLDTALERQEFRRKLFVPDEDEEYDPLYPKLPKTETGDQFRRPGQSYVELE